MFKLASITFLLSAVGTLAIPSQWEHSGLAKRVVDVTLNKRATFAANRVTWYPTDTGPDACTGKNHKDSDNIVALNIPQWGNMNGRSSACGKKIKIVANGVTAYGVIQDLCASCFNRGEIDLTKGLFQKFASLNQGVFKASWSFVDDDEGEEPEQPKTTKKPASPTTKSTPTPETTPEKHETTKKPSPTPTPEKEATSTKKDTKPTEAPEVSNPGNDDDGTEDDEDDEDCEEYEDDDEEYDSSEDDEKHDNSKADEEHDSSKDDTPPPVKSSSKAPVKVATVPPIKVDSTPSKVVVPPSPSSTSSTDLLVGPTVPIANPAPTPSASQDSNSQSGSISENSQSSQNGAMSLSSNQLLMSGLAVILIAFQTL